MYGTGVQRFGQRIVGAIAGQQTSHISLYYNIMNQGGVTMRYFHCFFLSMLILCSSAFAGVGDDMIHIKSAHNVKMTADRLEKMIAEKGMTVFIRIDHAQGAQKVGRTMRPTQLIIFGNPKVGTALMQCSQSAGIDLPLKALIWQDKEGIVWLSYNDPQYLARRHDIQKCGNVIDNVTKALNSFATEATKP